MASRTAFLVSLVSLVFWIAAGTRTVKDVLDMESKITALNDGEHGSLKALSFTDLSEWDPRIIGGRPAEEKEFPWMAALHYSGRFMCTGFLITPNYVMTAAHCVVLSGDNPEPADRFNAYLGSLRNDGPETEVTFSDVIAHKEYGRGTECDIALLKTKTPVETNDAIKPICLPTKGSNFQGTMAQAMGWGVYEKGGRQPSTILLTVPEHVPRNSLCQFTYGVLGIPVTDRHVCAGGRESGVCFGDSGGPLVSLNGAQPKAIGITSFGSFLGCAVRSVPAVFTSTEAYHDWIEESMGDDAKGLCYA